MTKNRKSITIFLLLAGCVLFAFLPSIEFLLNFSNDDSFFYLKTAYNFSTGAGSTFDLVNKTNGYHPLWFIIISAYFFILNQFTGYSPELYYRFIIFLICIISILNLFVLKKFFDNSHPVISSKLFFLAAPLYLTFVAIRDAGMETHITCLVISTYLLVKSLEFSKLKNMIGVKCLLIALLYLSRIDFLINVIPIVIFADFILSDKESRNKFLIYSLLTLFVTVALYSASNYFFFDSISSVTGRIKNTFPDTIFLFNVERLVDPGSFTNQFIKTLFVIFVILLFITIMTSKAGRKKFNKIDFFLFALCLSSFLYILTNLFFNTHSLKEWYVAFPAFVSSILLVRIIMLYPSIHRPALTFFILIFIFYFVYTRIMNPKWDSNYYYALELKKNVNEEDRIFMIDLSGIIGYFSERKVINGDGLANSNEYWDYRLANNLGEYLKLKDVKYYSTYSTKKGHQKVNQRSGFYNDDFFAGLFGGYPFQFSSESLVLKAPYYFSHAVNSDVGFWYLFKIK